MEKMIRNLLKSFLGRILYLEDDGYLLNWDGRNERVSCRKLDAPLENAAVKKCFVVVLGKDTYYETVKSFPITSVQDIKEAVRMEGCETCPFPYGQVFVRAVKQSENQSLVNLWYIKERTMSRIERLKPYILIPETALFGYMQALSFPQQAPEAEREAETGKIVVVHKDASLLFSFVDENQLAFSYQSGLRDIDEARERFRKMVGYRAGKSPETSFAFPEPYLEAIYHAFWRQGLKGLPAFQYHNPFRAINLQKTVFIRGAAVALSLILLYSGIFSLILYRTKDRLEEAYAQKKAASVQYTRMEEEIRAKAGTYREVRQKIQDYRSKVAFYNLLNDTLPDGTIVASVNVMDRDVEIRGIAPRASDVLAAFNAAPGFESSRFVSGVSKAGQQENQESFGIGFKIK